MSIYNPWRAVFLLAVRLFCGNRESFFLDLARLHWSRAEKLNWTIVQFLSTAIFIDTSTRTEQRKTVDLPMLASSPWRTSSDRLTISSMNACFSRIGRSPPVILNTIDSLWCIVHHKHVLV